MNSAAQRPARLRARWIISLILGVMISWSRADWFVAPDGNDADPGTRARPFATLTRARDAARHAPAGERKRILVRGGSYFNVSLELGPADSGLVLEAAPGAKPVLYGGERITGWKKDGPGFYAAPLPEFPAENREAGTRNAPADWEIRMLQVDGHWRPRARFPAQGALTNVDSFTVPWMSTTGGGWKRPPTREELTTLHYRPGDLGAWPDLTNAEITVFHMWDESCVGIVGIDPLQHRLTLNPPTGHPPGAFGVHRYVVWNLREGMTTPGQWYQDRARHRLVYRPLPGEDPNRLDVIAPTRTTILRIRGSATTPVSQVTVRGLTFSVTTVPLIAAGFAAAGFAGAISLEHTDHCTLDHLTIVRVAGHGINATGDPVGTRVEHCEVAECGAGGVYVGGAGTVIADNLIHAVGRAYPSATGIYRGGQGNRICHNEIHDCPYSAISYGGASNVFEDNLIYDCMKVLHDGAAIYLFAAKDCVIRGNLARDIADTGGYGASAYYLDERSTGCVVENNLALRVRWPCHNHMATNNLIRNNVFIVTDDTKLTFPRSTGYQFKSNVVYATGKIRIENPAAVTAWSHNLFFSGVGKIECAQLKDYSTVSVAEGPPGDTTVRDPRFADWENGDYRYRADSPTREMGIRPVDVSHAGRLWH